MRRVGQNQRAVSTGAQRKHCVGDVLTAVKSIGGVSIFSASPRSLAEWYAEHLGLRAEKDPSNGSYYCDFYQRDPQNPDLPKRAVWELLPTEHGAPATTTGFVLSYVVDNLAKALEQLRSAGIEIDRIQEHSAGRSAWIRDPEGRLIELWED